MSRLARRGRLAIRRRRGGRRRQRLDRRDRFVREGEFPAVRLLPAGRNLGFAPGVRFGALASRGETLVLLNNDTKVEKGWLSALVSALDVAPTDVAAVTGRIVSWDGTKVDYRDTLLAFDGHAFQKDFGRPLADVRDDPPGAARLAPCGGNMAIRKETFLSQGGFDDDFFAYLEDVDLGLRLASRGLGTAYEPRAVVRHRSGATGEALGIFNRGFLIEKNAFATFFKNVDDDLRTALLPAVLLTFLHRTERILRETAPGGGVLTIDPYRDGGRPRGLAAAPRGLQAASRPRRRAPPAGPRARVRPGPRRRALALEPQGPPPDRRRPAPPRGEAARERAPSYRPDACALRTVPPGHRPDLPGRRGALLLRRLRVPPPGRPRAPAPRAIRRHGLPGPLKAAVP